MRLAFDIRNRHFDCYLAKVECNSFASSDGLATESEGPIIAFPNGQLGGEFDILVTWMLASEDVPVIGFENDLGGLGLNASYLDSGESACLFGQSRGQAIGNGW